MVLEILRMIDYELKYYAVKKAPPKVGKSHIALILLVITTKKVSY